MSTPFFVLPLNATVIADTTTAGTSATNLVNDFIGCVWKSTGTSTAFLTIDIGSAQAIDFVSLLSCVASSSATMRIRAAASAATVTTTPGYDSTVIAAFSGTAPTNGRQHTFLEIPTAQTFQYWRIDLASLSGTTFEAGKLVIGKKLQPQIGFAYGGVRAVRDLGTLDYSADGVMYRRVGARHRVVNLTFPNLFRDEADTKFLPLIETVGSTGYLLLVTDGVADATRQSRMYLGALGGDASIAWRVANGYEYRASLESVI